MIALYLTAAFAAGACIGALAFALGAMNSVSRRVDEAWEQGHAAGMCAERADLRMEARWEAWHLSHVGTESDDEHVAEKGGTG